MSNDQSPADAAPYVQLFQKAHQKIVMLERLDEQMVQMIAKRQELQDELKSIQSQLNEEFDTRLRAVSATAASESPVRPHVTLAGESKRSSSPRFAGQTIESIGTIPERAVG
ncbi:MAG TPA: hypothetical protein VHD56_04380 [Tepidisphaeraceae bacterium]|nr:hypothetical protein [Tepidisphaeraceae bacterium]